VKRVEAYVLELAADKFASICKLLHLRAPVHCLVIIVVLKFWSVFIPLIVGDCQSYTSSMTTL